MFFGGGKYTEYQYYKALLFTQLSTPCDIYKFVLSVLAVFYSIGEIISFCCFTENKGIFCCHGSGIYRL